MPVHGWYFSSARSCDEWCYNRPWIKICLGPVFYKLLQCIWDKSHFGILDCISLILVNTISRENWLNSIERNSSDLAENSAWTLVDFGGWGSRWVFCPIFMTVTSQEHLEEMSHNKHPQGFKNDWPIQPFISHTYCILSQNNDIFQRVKGQLQSVKAEFCKSISLIAQEQKRRWWPSAFVCPPQIDWCTAMPLPLWAGCAILFFTWNAEGRTRKARHFESKLNYVWVNIPLLLNG